MASPDPLRRGAGEGGGSSDGRGGNKGFRLFGAWIQGPGDEATNRGGGGRQQRQREGEEQGECCAAVAGGESSRHGQGARRCRGPARRPMSTATPWTTEEHRRFLRGLEEKGKGKWAAIAKEFVKTRNGTQVASHAQKHFLRQQKEAAGVKSRGISIFGVALEAEEDGDDAAGAGESQGPGSVEAPQPEPDPSPRAPPPAPETPHRGPSSPSSPPQQRTPSPREVAAPPQPHGPFLLGVGAAPPPPMLHLAPPHAAFLPCQNVKFDPWVVRWPAPPWAAPVWLTGPSFAATHGQLQHHHHPFQQQLASVAPSSLSQNSEESSTDLATAA